MKVYRVLYWLIMIGALLLGAYSGSRLCWLLFFVQALVLVAALGIDLWTAFSFSYLQKPNVDQGEKGQTVELHIGIYNDKPFPFTRMRVTVEALDPAENQTLGIDLAPRDSCAFDLSFSLPMRGEYLVGMTWLELQDVFGLLPMRFDLRRLPYYRQSSLLVLPRVEETALPGGMPEIINGGGSAAGAGQEELSRLREWMPGDKMSRIHWAETAKTRTLYARQYEDSAGGLCLIWLDCRRLSDRSADRLAECAASLLYAHLDRGDLVDLRSGNPETRRPERAFSTADLTSLRQWLALLKFDGVKGEREALARDTAGEHYSRIYVLGGEFDPELARQLEPLEASCRYWIAGALPANGQISSHIGIASLGQGELSAFLNRHLGELP